MESDREQGDEIGVGGVGGGRHASPDEQKGKRGTDSRTGVSLEQPHTIQQGPGSLGH